MAQLQWRPLRHDDLADVARIAATAFPHHPEDPARFAERLALSPDWCFGLEDGEGALKGYLIAYPWPFGRIPPLNAPLGTLPDGGGALFLHDLALDPGSTGSGQASAIVEQVAARARAGGFGDIALVAVNDTARFWRRRGFVAVDGSSELRAKLASYGEGARYMRRGLAPRATGGGPAGGVTDVRVA